MFIELEPIFNNIGAKKEFSYSFSPEDGGIEAPVSVSGAVENRAGVVTAHPAFLSKTVYPYFNADAEQ